MRAALALALVAAPVIAAGCGSSSAEETRPSPLRPTQLASSRGAGSMVVAPAPCPEPAEASAAELAVLSGRTLAICDEGLASLQAALDAARRERDVAFMVCLDRAIASVRAVRALTVERATAHGDGSGHLGAQVQAVHALCEDARAAIVGAARCPEPAAEDGSTAAQ